MKQFLLLSIFAALTTATYGGIVSTTSCGGFGTWRELRIRNCEGETCFMQPGTPYDHEGDFITSSASPALCIDVTAIYLGFPVNIIDTELENSSVGQGQLYTILFTITPNDVLSGNELPVTASVGRCSSDHVEICRVVRVRVL